MRDESTLLALRPDLGLDLSQSTPAESFQNNSLRPILKMQHPLLIQAFQHYIHKRKDIFYTFSKQAKKDWIAHNVRTDVHFRYLLVGMVAGHFTTSEMTWFLEYEADAVKRLTDMAIQRLQSALEEFIP